MIDIDKFNGSRGYRLVLSPNRSIGWRDLVLFYLFMCLLVLAVGLFFAVQGKFNSRRKLELGCHGSCVEVDEFLNNFEKDELAFRLKNCIIRGRFSTPFG